MTSVRTITPLQRTPKDSHDRWAYFRKKIAARASANPTKAGHRVCKNGSILWVLAPDEFDLTIAEGSADNAKEKNIKLRENIMM